MAAAEVPSSRGVWCGTTGNSMNTQRLPPVSRREQLRLELLPTVDSLLRRRADLISDGFIEDYVALHWLEWNGGALRLTVTGGNGFEQKRARLNLHGQAAAFARTQLPEFPAPLRIHLQHPCRAHRTAAG